MNQPLKRIKFKHTKELVRIAISEGETQESIARMCRTQQSVVSKWYNGKAHATEQQIAPLLSRYGSKLNRTTARVYLSEAEPWDRSELGAELLALVGVADWSDAENERARELRDRVQALCPAVPLRGEMTLDALIGAFRRRREERDHLRIVVAEGPVVFRYSFTRLEKQVRRRATEIVRMPIARWLVHRLERSRFVLVRQRRRELEEQQRQRWLDALSRIDSSSSSEHHPLLTRSCQLQCADEAARWLSRFEVPMNSEELVAFVDQYVRDPRTVHDPHDELALPFLIEKMLIEHGSPARGVERIRSLG